MLAKLAGRSSQVPAPLGACFALRMHSACRRFYWAVAKQLNRQPVPVTTRRGAPSRRGGEGQLLIGRLLLKAGIAPHQVGGRARLIARSRTGHRHATLCNGTRVLPLMTATVDSVSVLELDTSTGSVGCIDCAQTQHGLGCPPRRIKLGSPPMRSYQSVCRALLWYISQVLSGQTYRHRCCLVRPALANCHVSPSPSCRL